MCFIAEGFDGDDVVDEEVVVDETVRGRGEREMCREGARDCEFSDTGVAIE